MVSSTSIAIFTSSSSSVSAYDSETGRAIAKDDARPDSRRCLLSSPRFPEAVVHEHETRPRALLPEDEAHAPVANEPLLLGWSEEEEEAELGREEVGEIRATAMALCLR